MVEKMSFIETTNINNGCTARGTFTLRLGGHSKNGYKSLNCGLYTDDDTDLVKKNIDEVLKVIGRERSEIAFCKQVHGNQVKVLKSSDILKTKDFDPIGEYDAIVTNKRDLTLFTYHADCFAIFFFDSVNRVIGLAHAGWKGVHLNISKNVINQMKRNFGTRPEDIKAFISPGIQKCCFEVDNDLSDLFIKQYDWAASYIEQKNHDKSYIDLHSIIKYQLKEEGIADIESSMLCTCCNEDKFFSYRRDGIETGRMGAFIELGEEKDGQKNTGC